MKALPLILALLAAGPALAEGDPGKGARQIGKCSACHGITTPDGTVIVEGGTSPAPDLHGIIGRPMAATDFAYSDGLRALAAAGRVWDEDALLEYIRDPTTFIRTETGQAGLRTSMTLSTRRGGADIIAWLRQLQDAQPAAN